MNNYTIKELSIADRPMEKMMNFGVESLSNVELLAILIGSGTKNKNAITLADELLKVKYKGNNLLYTSIEQLMKIDGIGLSKSCRIISGLELGKRLSKIDRFNQISFESPKSVADYLYVHYNNSTKEEFCVLFLDTKNRVISIETISMGTLNQSLVHPREVFRSAIMKNSNSIILAHNHPSGDPSPSKEDILITERLIKAGQYLGIKILDHLIIGKNRFISLREKNIIKGF